MKPILFNTEMVRAILDGRKTVTRRVIKTHIEDSCRYDGHYHEFDNFFKDNPYGFACTKCGYGVHPCTGEPKLLKAKYKNGDILYVRETWSNYEGRTPYYLYKADYKDGQKGFWFEQEQENWIDLPKWKPSIHMPKEVARIFLRVTDVRIERLQYITEEQAMKEGIKSYTKDGKLMKYAVSNTWWSDYCGKHKKEFVGTYWQEMPKSIIKAFYYLWKSTIKKAELNQYGWDANPYVFVYEFEVISKEEAAKESEEK